MTEEKKIKIRDLVVDVGAVVGQRVTVSGWVHRLGTKMDDDDFLVMTLRDGTGYLRCRLPSGPPGRPLSEEASVRVRGVLLPDDGGRLLLSVDRWELLGSAPPLPAALGPDESSSSRHLVLRRSETMSKVVRARSAVMRCLREHYFARGYVEVTPPTIGQSQVSRIQLCLRSYDSKEMQLARLLGVSK